MFWLLKEIRCKLELCFSIRERIEKESNKNLSPPHHYHHHSASLLGWFYLSLSLSNSLSLSRQVTINIQPWMQISTNFNIILTSPFVFTCCHLYHLPFPLIQSKTWIHFQAKLVVLPCPPPNLPCSLSNTNWLLLIPINLWI